MNHERTAIVIGGGIAGPAVSLFLARAGIVPTVYEAYPRAENIGGGFQIAPNGMRVLAELGLTEQITRAGVTTNDFAFLNHHGKAIGTMRTGSAGPAITLTRDAFSRVLNREVARSGIPVEYGKRLVGIDRFEDEVHARFEDGTIARADMLIAADGVQSFVRASLFEDHAVPRYTGVLAMGGLVERGVVSPNPEDAHRLSFMMGRRFQFGYGRLDEGTWGWWCHLLQERELSRDELGKIDRSEILRRAREAFSGWAEPVELFLAHTTRAMATPVYDVPALPSWHEGRIVLVGDAAHAMSPAGGQGASLALEDALTLGRTLADSSLPLEEAFARFEWLRRKRAESIVKTATETDRRNMRTIGAWAAGFRDLVFPAMAPILARALVKQYRAPFE